MAGGSPSRQPSGTTEAAARPTAPAAAGTGSGHDGPQPHAALLQPNTDFSRLLQSSDQLAQQLQSASARLSYLTEYAGDDARPVLVAASACSLLLYSIC